MWWGELKGDDVNELLSSNLIAPSTGQRPVSRLERSRFRVGVAFSLPLIIGLAAFTLFPVLSSLYFSLTDYPIFDPPKWIGIGNFRELFTDGRFWLCVWNTFYFVLFAVPMAMLVGLCLALLLNLKVRGLAFYRTMF